MDDDDIDGLVDLGAELIISILEKRPFDIIKKLVDRDAPLWFQNEEGISALHAAAFNEDVELIAFLLEKGAIWNTVDNLGNTAGDVCLSLNSEGGYRLIRDAGLRSEYLLSHLSSTGAQIESPSTIILRATDNTAAGSPSEFLNSRLVYSKDKNGQDICSVKIGEEEVGVMMGWERGIMKETVTRLCRGMPRDLKVLNVGFGLGIIDSMFQSLDNIPTQHYIIEAHPDVLKYMKDTGWYEKKGVKVLEGRWQDFVHGDELLMVGGFDVIYTDTFSESYQDLQEFFEILPDLLRGSASRFSFFNGLGATNAVFYDVYTQLAELHLASVGLTVEWSDVDVVGDDEMQDRWVQTREYFGLRYYRLPIARMNQVEP